MNTRPPVAVLVLTFFSFGNLYVPQPLLPVLAAEFGITAAETSLAITVTLLPLAIAPLLYGYILEGLPAQKMTFVASIILAICHAGIVFTDQWWQFIVLRSIAGLCIPALLTALMTSVSATAPDNHVRQAMAWYIATTIVGGFAGRALSGALSDIFEWRFVFAFWAIGVVVAAIYLSRSSVAGRSRFERLRAKAFVEILSKPGYIPAYFAIFCIFFVFAGLLNVLPFRLAELADGLSTSMIGLAYAGYLMGVIVTLGGQRITAWIRSEPRLFALGIILYAAGLGAFGIARPEAIYLGMFVFCAGMFLLHGRLSGHLNHLSRQHQGIVNGLYIASYYMGGTIGSWATPALYRSVGWNAQLALLAVALLAAALALAAMLKQSPADVDSAA